MYDNYTRQSLPSRKYRELLGSELCVFNSSVNFIIENILSIDSTNYSWHILIDSTTGILKESKKDTITRESNTKITKLFGEITTKRNRIIHSFQITDQDGEQSLATKDKNHKQYIITKSFLLSFIKDNEMFSTLLHEFWSF